MAFSQRFQLALALSCGLCCAGAASAQTVGPGDLPVMAEPFPDEDASAPVTKPLQDQLVAETAGVVFASIQQAPSDKVNESRSLSCDSKLAKLLDDPTARSVLERRIPDVISSPKIVMARGITLKQLARFRQTRITPADLAAIDEELATSPR